jgi:hypothetical protein
MDGRARCDSPAPRTVRIGVSILRYIVQGFGWELGAQAARASIEEVKRADQASSSAGKPLSRRALARAARQDAKETARIRKERDATIARTQARIEAELEALKKQRG